MNSSETYMTRGRAHVERGLQEHTLPPNLREEPEGMDDLQRWVSGLSGAALTWYGLSRSDLARWPLALFGAGLIYQGIAGDNLLDRLPGAQEIPVVRQMTSAPAPAQLRIRKSLTIAQPAERLYAYWRQLENLPTFMKHVKSIQDLGNGLSHWVVNVLKDQEFEWDARIIKDRPNEMIAWETLPDAPLQNRGYVKFIPIARGTEVSVSFEYDPPGGALGEMVGRAAMFIAEQQVKEEIRNFKHLMEAGEVITTEGQPAAR
jgi:uncharacterized membrane protein